MKKLFVLLAMLLLLAACGNEAEVNNATTNEESIDEEHDVKTETEVESVVAESSETTLEEETEVESEETLEEPEEEVEETVEQPVEEVGEESTSNTEREAITSEEIQVLVQDFIGYEDEVTAFEINDGDIYVSLVMATDDLFTPEDLAVNRYSQISDELLYYDGWNNLTIEFMGIGTISMNYAEAEMNEYGYYFPTMVIEERLF